MKPNYLKIKNHYKIAFKQLFQKYYPPLCFFARKIVNDDQVANDIVQEAFIYFWEKQLKIESYYSAKSYLFKLVKNRCLNYLRDNKRIGNCDVRFIAVESLTFQDYLIQDETYKIIYKAIGKLTPKEKEVIELNLDGLRNSEIAVKLNISINTVKTLKARAFKELRKELKENIYILFLLFYKRYVL